MGALCSGGRALIDYSWATVFGKSPFSHIKRGATPSATPPSRTQESNTVVSLRSQDEPFVKPSIRCLICPTVDSKRDEGTIFQMVLRFALLGMSGVSTENSGHYLCTNCSRLLHEVQHLAVKHREICDDILYLAQKDTDCINIVISAFVNGKKSTSTLNVRFGDVFVILLCYYIVGVSWRKKRLLIKDGDIVNLFNGQAYFLGEYNWANFYSDFNKIAPLSEKSWWQTLFSPKN